MVLPSPTVTVWAGSRATIVYDEGAVPTSDIRCSRSMRTVTPSTSAPAARHMPMASSHLNSTPTSSMMSMEASWILWTCPSSSRSTQGILRSNSGSHLWTRVRRFATRASRPRRTARTGRSVLVSVTGVQVRLAPSDACRDRR